ncbi:MAG: thiamine diphosphokinase [Eubacteriales bacterium]|nr:thiamine diphosphokinase [Eubacteriales bacterium]
MKALIIAAGNEPRGKARDLAQGVWDYIVCADGGAEHALHLGIKPDLIVGDFDSLSADILKIYKDRGITVVRLPVEKDFTDLEFAIEQVLDRRANDITIAGADGGEFDHELANYMLMARYAGKDRKIRIITSEFESCVISQSKILTGNTGDKFSLLPLSSSVEELTIRGAKFETEGLLLPFGSSRALRNEFTQKRVEIYLAAGKLLCLKYWSSDSGSAV